MSLIPPFPSAEDVLLQASPVTTLIALVVILVTAALVAALQDWRLILLSLAFQYAATTLFVARVLPATWALLRVVSGGLVCIMWFLAALQARSWRTSADRRRSLRFPKPAAETNFRLLVVGLAALMIAVSGWRIPLPETPGDIALACTWLGAMGFLALALTQHPLRWGAGMLMWLTSFRLFLPALEHSPLVEGTLGALELLLGLVWAYLILVYSPLPASDEPLGETR
ncbi:MAG TPA: hypothetical protein EYP04_09295 [Anaerolineae bacterium]|nr:hypothetical protein [Anaerolineae bacterium]HIQ05303.1 hypothetical protein [Anaerolineae bacterium]